MKLHNDKSINLGRRENIYNVYAPNKGAWRYIKWILTGLKGKTESNVIIAGDFLEKEMQPTPIFLPGESHGRSLVGYSPRVAKNWTWLSDFTLHLYQQIDHSDRKHEKKQWS